MNLQAGLSAARGILKIKKYAIGELWEDDQKVFLSRITLSSDDCVYIVVGMYGGNTGTANITATCSFHNNYRMRISACAHIREYLEVVLFVIIMALENSHIINMESNLADLSDLVGIRGIPRIRPPPF